VEIDAGTDDDVRILLQQGDDLSSISTVAGLSECVDECLGCHAPGCGNVLAYLFSDDAAKNDVGGAAQDFRADDVEGH